MSRRTRIDRATNIKIKEVEDNQENIEDILQNVFPLKIDKKDIELNLDPINDIKGLNSREVTFIGNYKNVEISCVCVIAFGDMQYHQEQYYYGFKMSEQLLACRNMANYFGVFNAHILEMANFINSPPKEPALFIVKPLFTNGTIGQYLKIKRRTESHLEPLHMMQMGITLFSILSDAHSQSIGLVDITLDSLYVSLDGGLYFDGFQSCIPLDKTFPELRKSWMDLKTIKCPETILLKTVGYKSSGDVFLASVVLLELIKDFKCNYTKLYTYSRETDTIQVKTNAIDKRYKEMIPTIEKCLNPNPEDRPLASEMLYWLESNRYQSLLAADI